MNETHPKLIAYLGTLSQASLPPPIVDLALMRAANAEESWQTIHGELEELRTTLALAGNEDAVRKLQGKRFPAATAVVVRGKALLEAVRGTRDRQLVEGLLVCCYPYVVAETPIPTRSPKSTVWRYSDTPVVSGPDREVLQRLLRDSTPVGSTRDALTEAVVPDNTYEETLWVEFLAWLEARYGVRPRRDNFLDWLGRGTGQWLLDRLGILRS